MLRNRWQKISKQALKKEKENRQKTFKSQKVSVTAEFSELSGWFPL